MKERDDLNALVDAVSQGRHVDWSRVEASADVAELRRRIRNLHVIAEVGRCARGGTAPSDAAEGGEPDTSPLAAGSRWGHLTLLEPLGTGTFATVYRAWDDRLHRHVALKLLHARDDTRAEEAALTEARLLARVRHPGIVTVHGVERHGDHAGFWMELVEGTDLQQLAAERGPLPAAEVRRIGHAIASALDAVHRAGVVHRDVKPQNVVLAEGGRIVLTDFGVGHARARHGEAPRPLRGTPLYLAPELLEGADASPASDVYALGVLLFHLLTGEYPVRGASLGELVDAHGRARRRIEEVRNDVPAALARAVDTATHPDRTRRYASAGAFAEALAASGAGRRGRMPRRTYVVGALLAAAAFLVVALIRLGGGPAGVDVEMSARRDGLTRALETGEQVLPADVLEVTLSLPAARYVYVLNLDSAGHAAVMFPIDGWPLTNPLPKGRTTLPGPAGDEPLGWTLSTDAGVETFYVILAETPLEELERSLAELPAVTAGGGLSVRPAGDGVLAALTRGITGMAPAPAPSEGPARLTALVEALHAAPSRADAPIVREIRLVNRGRP